MNIDVNLENISTVNQKSSLDSGKIWKDSSKKFNKTHHNVNKNKKRTDKGKSIHNKHKNIQKDEITFSNQTLPLNNNQNKVMDKTQQQNSEIVSSHSKHMSISDISESKIKIKNSQKLRKGSESLKSIDRSSKYCSAKSSAEKSLTNIKKVVNDRSLRLISNSPGFAHNPAQLEKALWKSSHKTKKREEIKSNASENKLSASWPRTPENAEKSIERYSDPKQSKRRDDYKHLFKFLKCKRRNLITYGHLTNKLDTILTNNLKWHIEMGFNEIYSGAEHMILTAFSNKSKKWLKQWFHTFAYNSVIKAYDVNKLNLEAPEGTSIFQTEYERKMAEDNYAKLMNKYQSQLYDLRQERSWKEEFYEQEPIATNSTWTIWNVKYYTIFEHWASDHHKKCIEQHKDEYDVIDKLWDQLNSELMISKPIERFLQKKPYDDASMKMSSRKSHPIEKYIHDRLVILQIETKSQPSDSKASSKMSWMIDSSGSRNIEDEKILLSKSKRLKLLNGLELSDSIRPYPQIKSKVRRHIFKYNQQPVRRSKRIKNKELKRSTHNKRLRQTYFATSYHSKNKTFNEIGDSSRNIKRKKYRETTLDEFFSIKEKPEDEEMWIEDSNNEKFNAIKIDISDTAKSIIKNVLHSKRSHMK